MTTYLYSIDQPTTKPRRVPLWAWTVVAVMFIPTSILIARFLIEVTP